MRLIEHVQDRLTTDWMGRAMRGAEEMGSTNTAAADWARAEADAGSVVVTEFQTAGRGRHGRTWDAHKGQNLTFSVVLRPDLVADRLGLITLAAGVAVAEAVEAFVAPHRPEIKWPNDVMLEGRKTCGMLLEASFSGGTGGGGPEFVVLGIGVNVNQVDFPEALAETATSLRLVHGRPVPRAPLFAEVLQALEDRLEAIEPDGGGSVRQAFEARMHRRGEPATLRFHGTDRTVSGTVRGITEDGALRLHTPDGEVVLHAGEVTGRRNA